MLHNDHGTEHNKKLISQLLQFVQKSRLVQDKLIERISIDDPNVHQLLTAIETGDHRSTVFNHPDCQLFLLQLLQSNKISYSQGLTVYIYLTALMQLTNKQPLREEDLDIKQTASFKVKKLTKHERLTNAGSQYIQRTRERFRDDLNIIIDVEKLKTHILSLPPTEQWLLKIPYNPDSTSHYDALMKEISDDISFMPTIHYKNQIMHCHVPSAALANYFIQLICQRPMKMLPIFGRISIETLRHLHKNEVHPISLYTSHIKSNMPGAHDSRCGPLPILLHDIGHTFWGSLLSQEERHYIFNEFLPMLEELRKQACQQGDNDLISTITEGMELVIDLGLAEVHYFKEPNRRLADFLSGALQLSTLGEEAHVPFGKIGEDVDARFIFLLTKKYCELSSDNLFNKTVLEKMLISIFRQAAQHADSMLIIQAIIKLAKHAAKSEKTPFDSFLDNSVPHKINWKKWHEKLKTTNDCQEIWRWANKHRHHELLQLILKHDIRFFPPYLNDDIHTKLLPLAAMNLAPVSSIGLYANQLKLNQGYDKTENQSLTLAAKYT